MPRKSSKPAEVAEEIKEKVEEAVAAVGEKVEAKKPGRRKAAPKAEGESAPAKRAPRAAAPAVYVEYGDSQREVAALVEAAKADYSMTNSEPAKDIKLYIKPEDGLAYYVINGVEGKVAL